MSDKVRLEQDGRIATIFLDAPERNNALTREDYATITDVVAEANAREGVQCLVIEGAGDAFTSGGDLDWLKEHATHDMSVEREREEIQNNEHEAIQRLYRFPKPAIAKTDGIVIGDGVALALACDLILASECATFRITHAEFGLCTDVGLSFLLPESVGKRTAKELVLTGDTISAEEAQDIGLVNRVYGDDDFEAEATDVIETIAGRPAKSLEYLMHVLDRGTDRSLEDALDEEAALQGMRLQSDDYSAAVDAFLESLEN